MVTLKDVARKCNVTVATVSRILNDSNTKSASLAMKEKVWDAVRELGYVPNNNAKLLRMGVTEAKGAKTKSIGCIFTSTHNTSSDPFFSYIARGVENQALRSGYIIKFMYSVYDKNNSAFFQSISNQRVDGVVVLGRFDKRFLEFLKASFKNIIYAGINSVGSAFDEVICDSYKASEDCVNYLLKSGHTDIGFLGEIKTGGKVNEHRYKAFLNVLENSAIKPGFTVNCDLTPDDAYRQMKEALCVQLPPSALFCANDSTAIGAMRALKEHGLRIPDDVSIISIDNIEMAQFVSPMLTTIDIPKEELGIAATKLLIDRIEKGHRLQMRIELPYRLIERESVKHI